MRKAIVFLTLLCLGMGLSAQEPAKTVVSVKDADAFVRQNIERTISKLCILGKTAAQLYYDTCNYIEVRYNPLESDPINEENISIKGMTLTVNDPQGEAVYSIHLRESELENIVRDPSATLLYMDSESEATDGTGSSKKNYTVTRINLAKEQSLERAKKELERAKKELEASRKELDSTLRIYRFVSNDDTIIELGTEQTNNGNLEGGQKVTTVTLNKAGKRRKAFYSAEERTSLGFLWGFNNWGSNSFNGLSGLEGAYNLRTSFSSWQLEMQYALIMTRHFNFSVGLGYESDIYKFSSPLIFMDQTNGTLYDYVATQSGGLGYELQMTSDYNQWSSRLVTRYLSLPITLGMRFGDIRVGLTALPALGLNTRHTGLKHEVDNRRLEVWESEDMSKQLRPYKMDLRLELQYNYFGIFVQVATSSLFNAAQSPDAFPFKIGLIFKGAISD